MTDKTGIASKKSIPSGVIEYLYATSYFLVILNFLSNFKMLVMSINKSYAWYI